MDENTEPLGFLAEQSVEKPAAPAPAEPQAEAQPPVAEPASETRQRGPDGKFLPKAAEAAPAPAKAPETAAPTATAPAPAAAEPGHIPISALLDEREKRQALEKQLAAIEAQRQPPPQLNPGEQQQLSQYQMNLRVSRKFAEREYGKEQIAQIHDWAFERCATDPVFNQQMMASEDPYEAAYQAFNRERVLSEVQPSELDEFKAWKAAKAQVQAAQPAAASAQQPAAQPLPRSLASAPGNGAAGAAHVPVGEGEAFGAAFGR